VAQQCILATRTVRLRIGPSVNRGKIAALEGADDPGSPRDAVISAILSSLFPPAPCRSQR